MCANTRLLSYALALLLPVVGSIGVEQSASSFETVHTSNAAILNRLGLAPQQIPDGHHKKRFTGPEPAGFHQPYSRRHGHRDSHVYIVKLPASPPYYSITKPHKSLKDEKITKTGPSFPVGFQGNGKPAKIYHWNLPVVKKINEKKRLQTQLKMDQAKKKLEDAKKHQGVKIFREDILKGVSKTGHDIATENQRYFGAENNRISVGQKQVATKHVRNNDKRLSYPEDLKDKPEETAKKSNAANKSYRLNDSGVHRIHLTNELHGSRNTGKGKKHRKKAAMSYYAPIASKSGPTSIHKNFSGNGKPKAFYVMEKSRKPVYYHPLLP